MNAERFPACVGSRFAGAASTYDEHSRVQRHAAIELAQRIAALTPDVRPRILEIGCGTGHLTEELICRFPEATLIATDIAPEMLAACQRRMSMPADIHYRVMDARQPSETGPFDLMCGSLVMQWFEQLPLVLNQLAQRLAPGGVMAFSLLGPETFREWRAAHRAHGASPGTIPFRTCQEYTASFPATGQLAMEVELWVDRPPDGYAFLRALRAIGADTPAPAHAPVSAARMRSIVRSLGANPPITYELLYACYQA